MNNIVHPQLYMGRDGAACARFESNPQQVIQSLSFFNTGTIVLHLAEPLPDRVLWFGIGLLLSLELSCDIAAITVVPDQRISVARECPVEAHEIFMQLENVCRLAKGFFVDTACLHWDSPQTECIVKSGHIRWPAKQVSIAFNELIDLAILKNQTAQCA